MKKLCLAFLMFLTACHARPHYYLYVFYAKTCPVCQSFIQVVIPQLQDEYKESMNVTLLDIDIEENRDRYAKICSLLDSYYVNDQSGSVPFIVLDGYFAKVGYEIGEDQEIIKFIHQMIHQQDISIQLKDVYYFKKGKSLNGGKK